MRWTIEEIEKLRLCVLEGLTYKELIVVFNRSRASLLGKINELGLRLNVEYKEECTCKECGIKFIGFKKENRKFCNSSCSAKYSNKSREPYSKEKREIISSKVRAKLLGRKKTKEEREKVSGDKNGRFIDGRTVIKQAKKLKERVCKSCNINKINSPKKSICEHCKITYYKFYRPYCEFKFKVEDYP